MSRFCSPLAGLFLLILFSSPSDAAAQNARDMLRGLDGVFSESEREAVSQGILADEGSFHVQRSDGFLRVTVETEPIGVASLCIGSGDDVHVLHASAALGSLRFRLEEQSWVTDGSFEWAMRDPSMSDKAIAARAEYLKTHGWVATTSSMGDPTTTEFLISPELTGSDDVRMAIGVMPSERPDVTLAFPPSATACADARLVRGYQPEGALMFAPSAWLEIRN